MYADIDTFAAHVAGGREGGREGGAGFNRYIKPCYRRRSTHRPAYGLVEFTYALCLLHVLQQLRCHGANNIKRGCVKPPLIGLAVLAWFRY